MDPSLLDESSIIGSQNIQLVSNMEENILPVIKERLRHLIKLFKYDLQSIKLPFLINSKNEDL